MDFAFTDDQRALAELADRILGEAATPERLKETEASADGIDRRLWSDLARANLLGVAVPSEHGGLGYGWVEVCLLLEAQGRTVAPVPLWSTLAGAAALSDEGAGRVATGETIVACAIAEPGADDPYAPTCTASDGRLDGVKTGVPAVHLAERIVVTTADGVVAVDPGDVEAVREQTSSGEPRFTLRFAGTPCEPLAVDVARFVDLAVCGLCAQHLGVAERALRITASYTSEREQFGRPLATFQAVQQRAADAYIDVEAMRWTMWQAAWRLSEGLDARDAVAVAKFWAAEGGQRALAAAMHLHGGIGVDVDYPVHRYFLWSKVLEESLGAATPNLARIGERIAR